MSVAELWRWASYEGEEPFPSTRIDLAGGIVASVIANANRARSTPPFQALDFMPIAAAERHRAQAEAARVRLRMPPPVSEEDAILQRLVAAYG